MDDTTHARWWGVGALVIALASCSTEPPGPGPSGPSTSGTSPTASTGGQAAPDVLAVHEDVNYYGACGNEVLHLDDERFYPLLDDEEVDVTRYGSGMGVQVSTVPMPSPGDDVGTLTVYSDGYARFVSENGKFDVWLTTESRTYNWVC